MQSPTLVLTRPRQQAWPWLQRLAALGVQAVSLPLIAIEAAAPEAAHAAWQALLAPPGAALATFVSPNAVEHFFAGKPAGQAWPAATLAACVGPGSAQALREAGVPADLIVQPPDDAASLDSEHLWPQLSQRDWFGRQVLMLRGDGGRDWLALRLREQGACLQLFSVYRRRCPSLETAEQALLAEILAAPRQHVWLFSSAEAIGHLQTLAPLQQDWSEDQCIATHERIAERARRLGFGHVVLTRPDALAVAQALDRMQPGALQSPAT